MRSRVRKIAAVIVAVTLAFCVLTVLGVSLLRDKSFDLYTRRLDAWVNGGGNIEAVNAQVVKACGMLIFSQANTLKYFWFVTFHRNDFDYQVAVCTKMTVNRVYKQPEFENQQMVKAICDDTQSYNRLFPRLCIKSGLRP